MNDLPTAKIKMIKGSARCLTFGLLGLLPVIGLPFALAALWLSGRVRVQEKHLWNAARPHRLWGVGCAALGAVVWSVVDAILILRACSQYISS